MHLALGVRDPIPSDAIGELGTPGNNTACSQLPGEHGTDVRHDRFLRQCNGFVIIRSQLQVIVKLVELGNRVTREAVTILWLN